MRDHVEEAVAGLEAAADELERRLLRGEDAGGRIGAVEGMAQDIPHLPGVTWEAKRRAHEIALKVRWIAEQDRKRRRIERVRRLEERLRERIDAEAWRIYEEIDDEVNRESAEEALLPSLHTLAARWRERAKYAFDQAQARRDDKGSLAARYESYGDALSDAARELEELILRW